MEYLLLIYREDESLPAESMVEQEQFEQGRREFYKDLCRKNQYLGSNSLEPGGARVRIRSGKLKIQDVPPTDSGEHLTGYYLIECDTMEEAVDAAARIPDATAGSIIIRPVHRWEPEL